MRFRLYREYGALNSKPVFDAFEQGITSLGHEISTANDAIPVIWSVLWAGRMASNQRIYDQCRANNKPVVIIEVGNLVRGTTWRISLNHIHGHGYFGNKNNLDLSRPANLGMVLQPEKINRRNEILIASQHQHSLQWRGMPKMDSWVLKTVEEIRQYTDRKIILRPHPRSPINIKTTNFQIEIPKQISGTYDSFDIDYNYHCVINFNSGPAVQAAIAGTPVICNTSSLAADISGSISDIENIVLPDRSDWFLKLCHTEWTIDEISQGIPLKRLESNIENS